MQHKVHVCPNGLTAMVAAQRNLPLVSLQFWVESGSIHEEEHAGAGISHLIEHMVFKGTEEFSGQELNERVPALGGSWNAYTSTDRTVYHIDGPAEHWREFLHLLAQLVFHPAFPEEEFERERDVIRREMAMYNDDPQDASYRALITTLFKSHPRRLPVIGEPEAFNRLSHSDMVNSHRRRYVPGNVFICAAGDVPAETFFQAVEEEVGQLPAAPLPPHPHTAEARQWGPRLHRREFAQPTSTLMLAWRVPHSNHPDAAAISILGSILGEGRSAWLYKKFHDEEGLAHDVSVMMVPNREGEGAMVLEADAERADRDTLRDAMLDYLRTLPEADFEEARLRTRRQMKVARLRTLSTVQGLAGTVGMSWHLNRNLNCMEEWDAALEQVTAADLARAAATYLRPERLTEVSVDPIGTNPPQTEESAIGIGDAPVVRELANGLRIVTRIDRRVPMAHATLAVRAGSPTETEQTAGINSLLSECLLKGTATRSAAQWADEVENLGASISGNAGNNTLSLSGRCLRDDLPTLLALLADAALRPALPTEAIETEKKAMMADVLDAEEDPASLAFRRIRSLCFGGISYGNHRDGTVESIRSLNRSTLTAHHARLMCGRNAVLAVAGDIDPEAVVQLAEQLFGSMPAGVPATGTPTPPQMPGDDTISAGKEQAVLVVALPALTATDDDVPLQTLFEEWCRDMSGPVFSEIRERCGLAYYAAAVSLLGLDTGSLYFYLGTAPEQVEEARTALSDILCQLSENGMPEDALERSRSAALTGRLLSLQSCGKQCSAMAVNTLLGLGADYNDRLPDMLKAITPQAMNSYIARILAPTATRTWVTVR